MRAISWLGRGMIVSAALFLLLANFIWLFHGVAAPMGYGGRSTAMVIATVIFGVLIPVGFSACYGVGAIRSMANHFITALSQLLYASLWLAGGWCVVLITGLVGD